MPRIEAGASMLAPHRMRELDGLLGRRRREHDRELVAAEPRDRCAAGDLDESGGEIAQELVAGVVAERVVDLLEAVEIDQQHCDVLVLARSGERRARRSRAARRGSTARSGRRAWTWYRISSTYLRSRRDARASAGTSSTNSRSSASSSTPATGSSDSRAAAAIGA